MEKRFLIFTIISMGSLLSVFAQNDVYSRLFYYSPGMFNPAATGLESKNFVSVGFEARLVEFDNHPLRFNVGYERKIDKINSSVAVYYYFNRFGNLTNTNTLGISYSYKFKFSDVHFLKLGVQLNVIRHFVDFSLLYPGPDGDPAVPNGQRSGVKPDINLGVWYSWKNLSIGSSFVNVFRPILIASETTNIEDGLRITSFLTFLTKYQINLSKSFVLTPAIYYFAYSSFNLNWYKDYTDYGLNLEYKKIINLGVIFSPNRISQWSLFAGGKIAQKVNIQFSYGFADKDFKVSGPSVEALVTYSINN